MFAGNIYGGERGAILCFSRTQSGLIHRPIQLLHCSAIIAEQIINNAYWKSLLFGIIGSNYQKH